LLGTKGYVVVVVVVNRRTGIIILREKNGKRSHTKPHQHTPLGFIKGYHKVSVLKYNTKKSNGEIGEEIQHRIGHWKGDSLSPM
jgi:hypothetical protein